VAQGTPEAVMAQTGTEEEEENHVCSKQRYYRDLFQHLYSNISNSNRYS
jgi:hypothetical protein